LGNNDSSFTGIPAQNISSPQADFSLFHHQDLLTAPDSEKPWNQNKLVNKLNHLNFIDGFIYLILSDNNGKYFLSKAHPLPCVKDELNCSLTSSEVTNNISKYKFDFLMIDDGLTAILAPIQLISFENDIIKLSLPEHSHVKKLRKTRRHKCDDIDCRLTQDNLEAEGKLIDFTPTAMGVRLSVDYSSVSFDFNNPVELSLSKKGDVLYSGPCSCIRDGINSPDGKIIFKPLITQMERFPKRKMRNPRQQITPSFVLRFRHPFFQKNIERDIKEISTAGFSIIDSIDEKTLLPGMIIPEIAIIYSGVLKITCSAQVLYRRENSTDNTLHFGLTFTDMDIKSYSNLNHILGNHIDSNARVSTEIDMDSLWEFFFDTGFIYGEKYKHLYSYRHDFKNMYQKLYQNNLDIARHFVYEKNGQIYGHISMVHAYNPSWLIHHFSARRMGNRLPGPSVLKQIIHYTGAYNRLPSAGMDHVMTYYQPNNRIIDRIFGAFTRQINNPSISSLDVFSYIVINKSLLNHYIPEPWYIRECSTIDFNILKCFYQSSSGGLMINAFGLDSSSEPLKLLFSKSGFKRYYRTYCLLYKDKPVAFFIINQSDLGLNLSDLLNSLKIIILDQSCLPWNIILSAISNFYKYYTEDQIPVLIYPKDYLISQNIQEEKKYALWILQAIKGSDDFLQYTNALIKA
jgi:hypothetical protein